MRFDVLMGTSIHGSCTRYTDRFAAGLLDARRSVTCTVPEMCTGSVNSGVAYRSRCGDSLARASAGAANSTLSISVSVPGFVFGGGGAVTSWPRVTPPGVNRRVTIDAAGFG